MMTMTMIKKLCLVLFLLYACWLRALAQNSTTQQPQTVAELLGYPATARLLVIHADDLGMNHSVNRAIFEAFENHWITSASILVPCPWLPEVVAWATTHPEADLGIHQALNSEWTMLRWGPVSPRDKVPSLLDADGYLPLDTPEVVKNAEMSEVETELRAQIDRAQAAGIHLTHLDTHMGALFESTDLYSVYRKMGYAYHLPILQAHSGGHAPKDQAPPIGEALVDRVIEMQPGVAPADWLAWYEAQLRPLGPGVYQLIVHLAHDDDEMRGTTFDHPDWGAAWRQRDFDMVKSTEFREFIKQQGFILVGWKELAKALPKNYGQ
jgi:chitin disaccharide deacetylase